MKTILALMFVATVAVQASDHSHHAKHNMVLYGEKETFLSHLVYKQPHHFQVILKVTLPGHAQALYLRERKANPGDQFIFLLDSMDMRDIQVARAVTGTLIRSTSAGERIELASGIRIEREAYEIIYFDELPLSLER